MEYFSDREKGPRPRTGEQLTPEAWGGTVALIRTLISTGAFGYRYPEMCPDGGGPFGTDEQALSLALRAEIPKLEWPLQAPLGEIGDRELAVPDTLTILDLIQFSYQAVAKPIQGAYHSYYRHYHLTFDEDGGREQFRSKVNSIFARNGIAYQLRTDGTIERLVPPVLKEALGDTVFQTKDKTLNKMLEDARRKFLNSDSAVRRESIERLWDCWERIKSLERPDDKKASITVLLNKAATQTAVREMLEEEARKLTDIGNSFHIRHTEVQQTLVSDNHIIDYLFHRLFCMIMLVLRKQ